jgi:MinD-like ATPase involved in chromosome partitioning or flagellar assembly
MYFGAVDPTTKIVEVAKLISLDPKFTNIKFFMAGDGKDRLELEDFIEKNKTLEDIVYDFSNGLRSAMSYLGFKDIENMRGGIWSGTITAVRTTANNIYEGFAHGK